jgi:hypothetical protein
MAVIRRRRTTGVLLPAVSPNAINAFLPDSVFPTNLGTIPQFCIFHFDFCILKLTLGQFEYRGFIEKVQYRSAGTPYGGAEYVDSLRGQDGNQLTARLGIEAGKGRVSQMGHQIHRAVELRPDVSAVVAPPNQPDTELVCIIAAAFAKRKNYHVFGPNHHSGFAPR